MQDNTSNTTVDIRNESLVNAYDRLFNERETFFDLFEAGANWQKEKDRAKYDKAADLLTEFVKMQNDPTYGDLVWRLAVKEKAEQLLNNLK